MNDYADYLIQAAPAVLWYDVQDVGDYQGSVYAVGEYKGQILIYEDYYGSCSGCGAWGEGGEPGNEKDVLRNSHLFNSALEAIKYLPQIDNMEKPDFDKMIAAIEEISLTAKKLE